MKRFILDSGIVNDLVNRRNQVDKKAADALKRGDRLGVGTPVLGELLAGLQRSSSLAKNLPRLERALSRLTLWVYDEAAARKYALIAADLRKRGIVIQQIDMQTAAIAFALGNCVVASKDMDFTAIPGLAVENWANQ